MDKTTHPFFVPDGDSRQQTAVLLVGTAREFGIPQREVAAVRGGFRISAALADVLYDEDQQGTPAEQEETPAPEPDEDPAPKATAKKTAAKKTSTTKKTAAKRTSSTNNEE